MPPDSKLTFCGLLKYEAKQFCLNTALHGYRFIVLPKRILLERVFWVIIVLVSLVTAVTLLCIAWNNFQSSPTLLVTDSTHHPIWNYPFPAVTICSYNKISKAKAHQLAVNITSKVQYYQDNRSVEELTPQFKLLFQLIFNNNDEIPNRNYTKLEDILESNDLKIEEVMKKLSPDCREILQRCKWKGEEKRCESIFEQIRTSEGFCCSFNYYALKNHTFSGPSSGKTPTHPRRVSACGYLTALEVLVNSNPDDYFATQIASVGHRVLIHNAYDFPDWSIQSMMVEKGIISLIGINPTITYSTENIRSMEIEKRNCLFPNERVLHNFALYTFHNCLAECRMNISRRLCGCIPFFYDNKDGTFPKRKICTLRDVACLAENKHMIITSVPGYDVKSLDPYHRWGTEYNECGCLPDCEYVDYLAEASSGTFTRKYANNQMNLFGGVTIKHQSVIRVYFNDLVATRNRKDVSFSWHTLLAYYGGLLGLFTGFSFVSAVELVYFFTIRLISDSSIKERVIKKEKKKKQKTIRVKPPSYEDLNAGNLLLVDDYRLKLRRRSRSNS